MNKKLIFLFLLIAGMTFAMPPKYPTGAYHSCIVGPPRETPKDLSRGSIETCVILVQFTDNRADTLNRTPARYDSMFYSTGVYYGQYRQGSLNDFFKENSYNQTDVRGGICGNKWWVSNHTYAYYDDGNYMLSTGYQLARDAVQLVDATVNFHQYDLNNDNHIDGVFVVHAGPGAEDTGNPHQCWSHAIPSFNYTTNDGVIIDGATNVPEVNLVTPALDTTLCCIGVMCHELGHVVGLPDLYDPTRNTWGVGYWSLMGYGAWGAGGNTPWSPSHADAWCKKRVNWLSYTPITSNVTGLRILDLETHPVAYRVWRNGVINDTFFILENRQNKGFDTPLPGRGLLIWHIDPRYGGTYHNVVDLEEADGCDDLDHGWGYRPDPHYYHHELGDSGDPYPGDSNNTMFGPNTYPSSNSNYGVPTNVTVRNITIVGDTVICDVIINTTEISEQKNDDKNRIAILQNPVKNVLTIRYSLSRLENFEIEIYDIAGRMIERLFSKEISGKGIMKFEPKNLPRGVYFLKIKKGDAKEIHKFIYLGM
ncbi:MAG: M6 family metalloprotease domain-containing protein [candidate division WOR-3 bacterium]